MKQGLVLNEEKRNSKNPGRKEVLDVLRRIRYLQIDPTNVVCRSQFIVLWSRLGTYDIKILDELLYDERALFEYWVHGASIALSEDYPLCRLGMRTIVSSITPYQKRAEDWLRENRKLADHIKDELSKRGPLSSKDFEDRSERRWSSTGWSNERNVGKMLEILHKRGEIVVHSRASGGGQRKWGLSKEVFGSFPQESYSDGEIIRRGLEISLRSMGVATALQMRDYYQPGRRTTADVLKIVSDMEGEGLITPIEIEGIPPRRTGVWYIHSEDVKILHDLDRYWKPRTTLLSPFDNLIYDRVRTSFLFGFNVIFEAYVPKEKRIFGYYVLPILHGDRLVGRIDPEMNREEKFLRINAIHLEKGVAPTSELVESVSDSVRDLATFLGADSIRLNEGVGENWRKELT